MTQTATSTGGQLVLVGAQNGVALIPSSTPLTRLNYFDGKFLRAEDLTTEQNYLRSLVRYSNQAGGAGIVHGFTATLSSGNNLDLTAGLAIDPAGRVLFLPHAAAVSIPELIEKSKAITASTNGNGTGTVGESIFAPCETVAVEPPSVTTTFPTDLYLIALVHAEALCGEEDVYGKLCEDACVTSTDRPYRTEGIVIRALPLTLCPPTCDADWLTATHRRSRVASAYFATERAQNGKNISGTRLMLDLWCKGAEAAGGSVVPVAIVSMNGDTVDFLDAWIARRERIEAPPRRYWAWQMMMRPWNVYLAQILHFQCHLHQALSGSDDGPGGTDPCAPQTDALRQAIALAEELENFAATAVEAGIENDIFRPEFLTRIGSLKSDWSGALAAADAPTDTRILITEGIIELPPAGYLPVVPGSLDVNTQVRRLLGEGVDLRFCSVRPDYVAHALEEVQHMDRICLLRGLENAANAEEVDILVPDGVLTDASAQQGMYFETSFGLFAPRIERDTGDVGFEPVPGSPSNGFEPAPGVGGSQPTPGFTNRPASGVTNQPAFTINQPADTVAGPQFRGAGRGERLATGGGALHFAGLLTQNTDRVIRDLRAEYETVERPVSDVATGEPASAAFGIRSLDLRSMFARAADRFATTSARAGRDAAVGATSNRMATPAAASSNRLTAASSSAPALWLTMRCEKDPLSLAVGESSELRLEAALGAAYQRYVLGARLMLQGDFYCDQKDSSTTARRVRGRAWGWVWINARIEVGGQVQTQQVEPRFIPVSAEIELIPTVGGKGSLIITVETDQGIEFSITTEWDGSPILAGLSLTIDFIDTLRAIYERNLDDYTPEEQQQIEDFLANLEEQNPGLRAVEVGRARLRENPEVEDEAHAHHATSIRALRTIESALDEDGFRASAELLLFPPAPPSTDPTRILPTRDWVLFHRRRSNTCDCCQPEPSVVAPPRRFQFYEITAPDDASVDEIREFFERGEESVEEFSEIVGVVQFDGGTAQLSSGTDFDAIRTAWRLANPESAIIYGGLTSEGAAVDDPATLGEQRVARVADIVRSDTPVLTQAAFDVLPFVPNGLSAAGVDGVVFLVTIPEQVATQCHIVLSFRDQGTMTFALERIGRGELGAVINEAFALGEVEFETGSNTVLESTLDSVASAWAERWPEHNVARAVVILPATNPIPADLAQSQAQVVTGRLNGQVTEDTVTSAEDVFGNCQSILLLEPTQAVG
ncbi:MAG: hypothetical protein GEU90_09060 [Gemmatimonas sp.]|nr:hypothetical protein [Gemmatimonas sp.]